MISNRILILCCALSAFTSSCKRPATEGYRHTNGEDNQHVAEVAQFLAENTRPTVEQAGRRDDWRWEWRSDIRFWGQVVDQSNAPVAGAVVNYEWSDLSKDGTSRVDAKTDPNGRTELSGVRGKRLVVRVSKDGYEGIDTNNVASCEYSDKSDQLYYRGSPSNPTILRLRRKSPPDVIVHRVSQMYQLTNRSVVAVDLLGQREVPEGSPHADLVVRVDPARRRLASDGVRFPWKVVFEAPNGGLQLTEARGYLAPDSGYERRIECVGDPDSPDWDDRLEVWLFVRSRTNRLHSQIRIFVSPCPRFDPAVVRLQEYYSNPTGGRGLEYSPTMDVTEKYYVPR